MLNPRRKTFSKSNCNCRAVHNLCGENAYSARAAQGSSLGRTASFPLFNGLSGLAAKVSAPLRRRSFFAYFGRDNMFYLRFCNVSAGKHHCFGRDNKILLSRHFPPRFTCTFATFSQVVYMALFVASRNLIVASNGGAHHA